MDDLYLGIDLGTSATKAVLVDGAGRVVARSSAAHSDSRTASPGRVDPGPWGRSLAEACAALGPRVAEVTAVCAAVHSPVALFLDSDGVPVGPGIGWEDPQLGGPRALGGGGPPAAGPRRPGGRPARARRGRTGRQPDPPGDHDGGGLVGRRRRGPA